MSKAKDVYDTDGVLLKPDYVYRMNNAGQLINYGLYSLAPQPKRPDDAEAEQLAKDFPAYWKPLPAHWRAIDTYRVDDLFPLPSSRLYHARKKLLVPGTRTGGKSVYHDLKEAHRTLGAWLAEQPEHQA